MIPLFFSKIPNARSDSTPYLREVLNAVPNFDAKERGEYFLFSKKHIIHTKKSLRGVKLLIPRGALRLFVPRLIAKIYSEPGYIKYKIKLDGVAFGVFLFLLVSTLLETSNLFPREQFSRDYPAAFVYVLFGAYVILILFEVLKLNKTIKKVVTKNI